MKLKKIIKDIPQVQVKGSKEIEITGISSNSKLVSPGNLFVARSGLKEHGSKYIPEAISAGAVAIVTDMYDPTLSDVVQVIHPDPGSVEGTLAAEYYQHPSEELFTVGITGTCGKTTSSYIAKSLLDQLGGSTGLIGTVQYIIGQNRYQANRTTPDVSTNHKLFREMVNQKCDAAVMEVSSHALDQKRVDRIHFSVGVFTNLSQDHLDYHPTMKDYFAAKKKLFLQSEKAILNADAPETAEIISEFKGPILTYGLRNTADLTASSLEYTAEGTSFTLNYKGHSVTTTIPLIGQHNVYNALAATGIALTRGHALEAIASALPNLSQVVGRLESVPNALGLKIFVDFAHKEDALKKVLESFQVLNFKRLIVVFGCGGDRDRTKRPKMGAVCESYADVVIITNDNPRTEDPQAIAQEILSGFKDPSRPVIELDRRTAIAKAIAIATPEDCIVIAGRGHESHQIFAHHTIQFEDCKVAAQLCDQFANREQYV
jgi:UDP-N-acetylmuramoyl-L-alanyl-D-glutamate--2,6-diaminopimelate ligase